MKYIPYGRQSISQEDIDAVVDVLKSDWLTTGPSVKNFEKAIADYCGAQFSVAVNSATSALHIACLALGVAPGDYVWTSANTFAASANCALYCGAQVDFIDINLDTYNISVMALEEKLEVAEKEDKLPKVVIPVHFAGQSCDMRAIKKLADKYHFYIIEDASHAIGGKYLDKPIGCCEFSDITIFSFHPVKIVTTGEGGMALTNSAKLSQKMQLLRAHGITDNKNLISQSEGPWYYEQIELGFNYRITDLQCALGISQMKRLDQFVERRHELAAQYNMLLADLPVITPYRSSDSYSALHLYPIMLDENCSKARRDVFESLRAANIGVNVHYIPVYRLPYYQCLGFQQGHCPNAEAYYDKAISLPLYTSLSDTNQKYVVNILISSLCS